MKFEWDENKSRINTETHGISFYDAQYAFADPRRLVLEDVKHSGDEKRYFCIGLVNGGVATVRFTIRGDSIRILGAGYWRKGKKLYEQDN